MFRHVEDRKNNKLKTILCEHFFMFHTETSVGKMQKGL